MKCPKCGYLGFETSERCRNCGYDFSLSVNVPPAAELPLHSAEGAGEPLADFDLSGLDTRPEDDTTANVLDLDRIIGADASEPATAATGDARPTPRTPSTPNARRTPKPPSTPGAPGAPRPGALPLFTDGDDDTPLITSPRPLRPPLAVRRTTPEIPRTRARRVTPVPDEDNLAFTQEPPVDDHVAPAVPLAPRNVGLAIASPARRLGAAAIDGVLLGGINVAVVYLTLALAGLSREQMNVLPLVPMIGFFAILDGGYLVAFIAASGQTIGKMLTGIRVIGDDGQRVDIAGAVLRAAGCGVTLLTAGLGYLPALMTTEGRALQDRISGTRVVSDR